MNFKGKISKKTGITLISLVVTIIILLILAGISISMLTGQNGILKQATNAKESGTKGNEKELINLSWSEVVIKKSTENTEITDILLDEALANQFGSQKAYSEYNEEEDSFIITVIDTNNKYIIGEKQGIIETTGIDYSKIEGVAAIGEVGYETLQQAINAVPTNDEKTTIVMLKSTQENIEIAEKQNIILNLNGKTLTKLEDFETIINYGTLQVQNGTIIGDITTMGDYYNTSIYSGICTVYKNINILGTVYSSQGGTTNITNGNIDEVEGYWEGKIDIQGGNIEKVFVGEEIVCTITGGKIVNGDDYAIYSYHGDIFVSENSYIENNSSEYATIWLQQPDDYLEINGGTIINKAGYKSIDMQYKGSTVIIKNNPTIIPKYGE